MSRLIVWALGTMGAAALSATSASDRIAASLGLARPPRPEASASASAGRSLTVSADLAGHFVVHPALNGQRVRMLVDTGASSVALSHEDAALLGIRVEARDFRGSCAPRFAETPFKRT